MKDPGWTAVGVLFMAIGASLMVVLSAAEWAARFGRFFERRRHRTARARR